MKDAGRISPVLVDRRHGMPSLQKIAGIRPRGHLVVRRGVAADTSLEDERHIGVGTVKIAVPSECDREENKDRDGSIP